LSFEAFKMRQVPQMSIVGSNFPLIGRTAVLNGAAASTPVIPVKPTHVVTAPAAVRQAASDQAPVVRQLKEGVQVRVIETSAGWVLIARDGHKLGYVEASALLELQ